MTDTPKPDNRATVTLGGRDYEVVASLRAERNYGDRFRDDVGELGRSNVYYRPAGKDTERVELEYTGRFKADLSISAMAKPYLGDVPVQVFAAVWAMGRAAGSIEDDWDVFLSNIPSDYDEHVRLWEVVCVDLADRAVFRHGTGQIDVGAPDDGEGREG